MSAPEVAFLDSFPTPYFESLFSCLEEKNLLSIVLVFLFLKKRKIINFQLFTVELTFDMSVD